MFSVIVYGIKILLAFVGYLNNGLDAEPVQPEKATWFELPDAAFIQLSRISHHSGWMLFTIQPLICSFHTCILFVYHVQLGLSSL